MAHHLPFFFSSAGVVCLLGCFFLFCYGSTAEGRLLLHPPLTFLQVFCTLARRTPVNLRRSSFSRALLSLNNTCLDRLLESSTCHVALHHKNHEVHRNNKPQSTIEAENKESPCRPHLRASDTNEQQLRDSKHLKHIANLENKGTVQFLDQKRWDRAGGRRGGVPRKQPGVLQTAGNRRDAPYSFAASNRRWAS